MLTNEKHQKRLAVIFFAIIGLMFCAIAVRTVTRQVLIKQMGMDNAFTKLIFFDQNAMLDGEGRETNDIKWYELYQFPDGTPLPDEEIKNKTFFDKLETRIDGIAENIEIYCTDFLPGYDAIVLAAKKYEQASQWNYVRYAEYNGVITLSDGYLSGVFAKIDVTASADSTEQLRDFCAEQDVDFLYVQYPHKNCVYQDTNICGISDYSNQNADDFLQMLEERNIPYLDLRSTLHAEGIDHHAAFFRTDHHWTPETGMWAAQRMLEYVNGQFGSSFETNILDEDNFEYIVYPKQYLGSQGKKERLPQTDYDDITLITPKFHTDLTYSAPYYNIFADGDFSVMLDMESVENGEFSYHTYNYGDQPLTTILNNDLQGTEKILILHDSFSDVVVPFLGLCVKEVDAIDLRHFNGSIQAYIEEEKPSIVILAYYPGEFREEIDPMTHDNPFDFR